MKKLLAVILVIGLLFSTIVHGEESYTDVTIEVNDEVIKFDNPPIIRNGRTMAPLRAVFEQLGLEVVWNGQERSVTGKSQDTDIWLQLDNPVARVNGKEVILEVPAFVIEGRTYVPVRFLGESTGCEVGWIGESRTVTIDKKLNPEIELLHEKVQFKSSELLFTVFAFINYTGYDHENGSCMHEVRVAVREELDSVDLQLEDNDFFTTAGVDAHRYINAARCMDDAFNYTLPYDGASYLKEHLPGALQEFYEEANIHNLYIKYKPMYEEELENYDVTIEPLRNTLDFLRINIESSQEFYVQINLLDAYWSGKGLGSQTGTELGSSIITGPSDETNTLNIIHEYLHGVINPITKENYEVIEESGYLYNQLVKGTKADNPSYDDWESNVNESLVRALSAYFAYDEERAFIKIDREVSDGFVMTRFAMDKFLADYPSYEGTLEEFVVELIREFANRS